MTGTLTQSGSSHRAWIAMIAAAAILTGCSNTAAKQEQAAAVEAAAVRAEAAAARAEQAANRMAHANAANAAQTNDDTPVEEPSPSDEAVRVVVDRNDVAPVS